MLPTIKKEMYSEKEKYDTIILSLDNQINLLMKNNTQLKNILILLDKYKEKSQTDDVKLIRKDKYINKLKESIKKDFLEFNQEIIPESYLRISNRFPHLNLQEIILFEKKIRENGGSIRVHGGKFGFTKREIERYQSQTSYDYYLSWTCCTNVCNYNTVPTPVHHYGYHCRYDVSVKPRKCRTYEKCRNSCIYDSLGQLYTGCGSNIIHNLHSFNRECCEAVSLKNPKPDGECDCSETFYLREEDEKLQDIKKVSVENVSLNINNNIKTYEETIEKYLTKISKLKSLQHTLDLLIED